MRTELISSMLLRQWRSIRPDHECDPSSPGGMGCCLATLSLGIHTSPTTNSFHRIWGNRHFLAPLGVDAPAAASGSRIVVMSYGELSG